MIPFRSHPPAPRLQEGYRLLVDPERTVEELNRLLLACGDRPRQAERWELALARSAWHLGVVDAEGRLVGFVRATSDQALNANLWDLLADPTDPWRAEVLAVLVHHALGRLRRELSGCSVSIAAPPEALDALTRVGFVVDPGGIRAMGLELLGS